MKKTVTFVWSIFLLVFISIDMNAQSIKSWDYPIKPGTEAWQALSTHEDMLKACQIPAEILKTVSTEELIELCLAYPLLGDIFAYNGIQEGISKVSARFNGLQELFKRKDNASLLFEKMKKQELLKAGVLTSIEIVNEISRQMVIEALLSNETILSNTNNLLQQEISSEAVKRLLYKQNNPDIYGQYGLKTVVYLLGRSLERIDNKTITPKFKQFTIDEKLTGSNVIEELLKQYIVTFNKLRS